MGGALERKPEEKSKGRICIGLLAHVDAGKTTLAEGLLYTSGRIRRLGRVDHKDAFLDNFSLERERGITIFSKQAQLEWEGLDMALLDTPGHVDFSAEMERTLQVLDYAVLVISGSDGVQGHVQTLWRLLGEYGIPVFLFINKMDQPGTDRDRLLQELQNKLDGGCQAFGPETGCISSAEGAASAGETASVGRAASTGETASVESARYMDGASAEYLEELSMCDEALLEEYLETGTLEDASLARAIAGRRLFPCYFGSALRLEGVEELLKGIRRFALCPEYPQEFGARVYKISRDASGNRLTHLKVTGGVLRVKMPVSNACSAATEEEVWEEKADQLRVYGGGQYEAVEQVEAGGICAVTGLEKTFAGQGLGRESENELPILAPVLTYGLVLPEGSDAVKVLGQLRKLEEEEPQLHVVWQKAVKSAQPEIHVQVMGEVQIEILKRLILERFGLEVEFTDGQIMYKETIASTVEGIGHFEPLRHYAEVHLLLEPGEPGSGLQIASACSEDVLDRNWQRLIFTHLEERSHLGVLTGSPITDMKITLLTGRAHLKHTEGGDFRQATYRALRQGLMQCENVLLEPVFSYTLEVPAAQVGRAISDIQRMCGRFDAPQIQGEFASLTGSAPASTMQGYQSEVNAYTKGMGRLSCTLKGYEPCHDTDQVIASFGYYPDADVDNPSSSVFCAHGAGFLVPWDQVAEYAHVESGWSPETEGGEEEDLFSWESGAVAGEGTGRGTVTGKGTESGAVTGEGTGHGFREEDGKGEGGTGEGRTRGDWAREDRSGGNRSGHAVGSQAASMGGRRAVSYRKESSSDYITQEEIEEIFTRTYGKSERDYTPYRYSRVRQSESSTVGTAGTETSQQRETNAVEASADGNGKERRSQQPGIEAGAANQQKGAETRIINQQTEIGSRSFGLKPGVPSGGISGNAVNAQGRESVPFSGNVTAKLKEYLLVDGYNIIFAWEDLHSLAEVNIDSARDKLMDICCNYQGFAGCTLILVFDAYKVKGNTGSAQKYHNIHVVYTKEAETADQYIEKTVHEIGRKHRVTVATSDRLEQMIIWGAGATRLSAAGFREVIEQAARNAREQYNRQKEKAPNRPFEGLEIPDGNFGADSLQ